MKKLVILTVLLFTAGITTAMAAGERQQQMGQQQVGMEMQQQIQAASDLKDFSVRDQAGEDLGNIDQILVDVERGQIGYVVVSTGLIGGEKHLIPWNALQPNIQEETLTVNIDQQRFEQAPTGEMVESQQQAQQIHQFYGVSPYWEEGAQQQQQQQLEQQQRQQQPQQQRQY